MDEAGFIVRKVGGMEVDGMGMKQSEAEDWRAEMKEGKGRRLTEVSR